MLLQTPPDSPSAWPNKVSCRKSRHSLSDWWAADTNELSDSDVGESEDCMCETFQLSDSTTASEAGDDMPDKLPISPRKGLNRKTKPILAELWVLPVDLEPAELTLCSPAPRRRRHTGPGRFAEQGGSAESAKQGEVSAEAVQSTQKGIILAKSREKSFTFAVVVKVPMHISDATSFEGHPMFEGGVKGALKDLMASHGDKQIDLQVLVRKRRFFAAPSPEEFASALRALIAETSDGKEGNDKQLIIEASRKYTKIFSEVMGMSDRYSPSLDGGLDVAIELLSDMRESAWSLGSWIFKSR